MNRPWFGLREPAVAEGSGARVSGQVPMVANAGTMRVPDETMSRRSWWAAGVRVVRNAIIAAAMMATVPLAVVGLTGNFMAASLYSATSNTRTRMQAVQPVRAFGVAADASVTPMQAGLALNALQYRRPPNGEFAVLEPATRPARPWRTHALAPDMFATARPDVYDGPASKSILEAAAKGFSAREQEYVRTLAESPIWNEFDLVARARAVDVVGGQLRLPFAPDALPEERPLPSFKDSKELAYAAVSRAAYYMSVGRTSDAEHALRSIVSFGFTIIDNGTTTLDELIGTVIVGIGRDALQRFYVLEHDPRALLPALAAPHSGSSVRGASQPARAMPPATVERLLLARLTNPATPRPERLETVRALSLMSCTNARGLLLGPSAEVTAAIERVRNTVARYPSERALVDLATRLPSLTRVSSASHSWQSVLVSPATVASVVLQNPRMAACTLILTSGR
jgi:hypothetical protein